RGLLSGCLESFDGVSSGTAGTRRQPSAAAATVVSDQGPPAIRISLVEVPLDARALPGPAGPRVSREDGRAHVLPRTCEGVPMTDAGAERQRIRALIEGAGVAMLMNVDEQGRHAGRPMLPLLLEDDPHIHFLTHQSSRKVRELAVRPR